MRNILIFSIFLVFSLSLHGISQGAEKISSLCEAETMSKLQCEEDDRDCVFKTTTLITDFLGKYEIPEGIKTPGLRYPQKCLHRSYQEETVNIVFDVSPEGKVINVRVLNSSNDCFDRKARNYARGFKFITSSLGFECLPISAKFKRPPVSDAAGRSY